jgi:hypothetical protein
MIGKRLTLVEMLEVRCALADSCANIDFNTLNELRRDPDYRVKTVARERWNRIRGVVA